ncbi:MAG: hypothetical protein ACKVZ0_22770 [Gemmatimonadales bacterium]
MSIRLSLSFATFLAAAALGTVTPAAAQDRSAVSAVDLDAAVTPTLAAHRAVVGTVAGGETIAVAPTTLGGERTLAGGADRVVISTTVVIIALLILILVVD